MLFMLCYVNGSKSWLSSWVQTKMEEIELERRRNPISRNKASCENTWHVSMKLMRNQHLMHVIFSRLAVPLKIDSCKLILLKSVKINPPGRKNRLIPHIPQVLLQNKYHCIQYTKCNAMHIPPPQYDFGQYWLFRAYYNFYTGHEIKK